jgi:hypothetical protein
MMEKHTMEYYPAFKKEGHMLHLDEPWRYGATEITLSLKFKYSGTQLTLSKVSNLLESRGLNCGQQFQLCKMKTCSRCDTMGIHWANT